MRASDFRVYVRDRNLKRVGVLAPDDLSDLVIEAVASGVGAWKLTLPERVRGAGGWERHLMCAALREPGAGIVVRKDGKTVFSGPMVGRDLKVAQGDPWGTWSFAGASDETVLDDALAWPNPSSAVPQSGELAADARSGKAAAVLAGYVRANIGEGAPAERRGLFASKLVTAGVDVALGGDVVESVRYENLLEVCQRIARVGGVVFRVVDENESLVLQVYVGRDRSLETRWTVRHGMLEDLAWEAGAPGVTRPLVGGSGVGEYRPMVAPTTPETVAAEAVWGRKRELFIDARGTDEVAELTQRGVEALEHQTAGIVVNPSGLTAEGWGAAWQVGDVVRLPEVDVSYPIASVPIKFSGGAVSLQAVLGATADVDAVERSVESRVSNIERNAPPQVLSFELLSQAEAWEFPDGTKVWVEAEQREFMSAGGTLHALADVTLDTEWTNLTPPAGAAGTFQWRIRDRQVSLRIDLSMTFAATATEITLGVLPLTARPADITPILAVFNGTGAGAGVVHNNRNVIVKNLSGATKNRLFAQAQWDI